MDNLTAEAVLGFLGNAEALKDTLRTAYPSKGRRESAAEHTWRLCLLAAVVGEQMEAIDTCRLLRMCLVHDLGEAIRGDIPAIAQDSARPKAAEEREDLERVVAPLPPAVGRDLLGLWDEYERAETAEARLAKALDRIETLAQHTRGKNPVDFDYRFNLTYGRDRTDLNAFTRDVRRALDAETEARLADRHASEGDI